MGKKCCALDISPDFETWGNRDAVRWNCANYVDRVLLPSLNCGCSGAILIPRLSQILLFTHRVSIPVTLFFGSIQTILLTVFELYPVMFL